MYMRNHAKAECPDHGSMQDQSPERYMRKVARLLPVPICRRRQADHTLARESQNSIAYCTRLLQ